MPGTAQQGDQSRITRSRPFEGRQGQLIVLFAGALVLLVILAALAVDTGRIVTTRAELQNAVDAAALAGAKELIGFVGADEEAAARSEAISVAKLNLVAGDPLTLDPSIDIQFGRYVRQDGSWQFQARADPGDLVDSMQVTGRRTPESPDGSIELFFASIFGMSASAAEVRAVATQPRRYVMFVMDRSGSMMFDTTGIAYHYLPESDGSMQKSPTGWYWMPREIYRYVYYYGWRWMWTTAWFYARDDDTGEIRTDFLPEHIRSRLDGGMYFRYRDRDDVDRVQSGWLKVPDNVTIYSRWNESYLSWRTDSYYDISESDYAMATQPIEPMASSQNAATAFVDLLRADQDRAGLVTYGYGATLDSPLTDDWQTLKDRIGAYDPRGATATPMGMERALDELLLSGRAEGYGQRIVILLTDGNANLYNGDDFGNPHAAVSFLGQSVTCDIDQTVASAIAAQAQRAAANGVRIYTVSFGQGADRALMPLIADATDGAYYYADEAASLVDIFVDIFHRLPPLLTR